MNNRAFDRKWVSGIYLEAQVILGHSDIQSLADLANAYDRLKSKRLDTASQKAGTSDDVSY